MNQAIGGLQRLVAEHCSKMDITRSCPYSIKKSFLERFPQFRDEVSLKLLDPICTLYYAEKMNEFQENRKE